MSEAARHAASRPGIGRADEETRWEDLVWASVAYQFGRDEQGYMVRLKGETKVLFRAADLAEIEERLGAATAAGAGGAPS